MASLPASLLVLQATAVIAPALALMTVHRELGRWTVASRSWPRLVGASLVATVLGLASVATLARYGLDIFGAINLVFVDLAVGAPALGLTALVLRRQGRACGWPFELVAAGLLAVGVAGFTARFIEPRRLQLERPSVTAGSLARPIRIGLIADLQTDRVGGYEQRAIERLLAERPDLILLPGDVFQGDETDYLRELPRMRQLLGRLEAPLGVFAVIGNSDRPRDFASLFEGTSVTWLHNQIREIETPHGTIVLGATGWVRGQRVRDVTRATGAAAGPGRLSLLLTHDPGVVYGQGLEPMPELVVAGHTHGGQINLPWIGALITLSRWPAAYAFGLHRVEGAWFYVSRGVGLERGQAPRIRFFCPPEITLLTVSPASDDPRGAR